jgi:hypothetical protein
MMYWMLDHHIELLAGVYSLVQIYQGYAYYFKVKLDTDNINLIELYNKRRGL